MFFNRRLEVEAIDVAIEGHREHRSPAAFGHRSVFIVRDDGSEILFSVGFAQEFTYLAVGVERNVSLLLNPVEIRYERDSHPFVRQSFVLQSSS